MSAILDGWPHEVTPKGIRLSACAPHDLVAELGDKWTILVVSLLAVAPNGRLRFSEIKYGVEGISQRMLTQTLRNLQRDGLVTRYYFAEGPPRVEYELSEIGWSLQQTLKAFAGWMGTNWPAIEQARLVFDDDVAELAPSNAATVRFGRRL
jgi:DNA-binding HxlR family transcriptional regulator